MLVEKPFQLYINCVWAVQKHFWETAVTAILGFIVLFGIVFVFNFFKNNETKTGSWTKNI